MLIDVHLVALHPTRRGRAPKRPPAELVELLRQSGPVVPAVVQPAAAEDSARYWILAGVDVWRATQAAALRQMLVHVEPHLDEAEVSTLLDSDGLPSVVRSARALQSLVDAEAARSGKRGAVGTIASRTDLSRSQIAHRLRLLSLEPEILDALERGTITEGHGRALLRLPRRGDRLALLARIVRSNLSVREAERQATPGAPNARPARATVSRQIEASADSSEARAPSPKSSDTTRLENLLTESIGSPVALDEDAGLLVIRYFGHTEVLVGIIERIGEVDERVSIDGAAGELRIRYGGDNDQLEKIIERIGIIQ